MATLLLGSFRSASPSADDVWRLVAAGRSQLSLGSGGSSESATQENETTLSLTPSLLDTFNETILIPPSSPNTTRELQAFLNAREFAVPAEEATYLDANHSLSLLQYVGSEAWLLRSSLDPSSSSAFTEQKVIPGALLLVGRPIKVAESFFVPVFFHTGEGQPYETLSTLMNQSQLPLELRGYIFIGGRPTDSLTHSNPDRYPQSATVRALFQNTGARIVAAVLAPRPQEFPPETSSQSESLMQATEEQLIARYGSTLYPSIEAMPPEVKEYFVGSVQQVADFFNVRPGDIVGILQAENNNAGLRIHQPEVSTAGASGVGQIVPRTWNG